MAISYKSLYGPSEGSSGEFVSDRQKFRSVSRTGFNVADSYDQRFFKILFYFYNDNLEEYNTTDTFIGGSSGLLSPTWLENPTDGFYKYNSAWAYLKNNYEEERADALKNFVELLSQISSESPWYFQEISGVDDALNRNKFVIPEERKKISIKCMADPIDHRIESLLSLYRSIVWSHARKCEILPANLRKFDMGLFVFSGLNFSLHAPNKGYDWAKIGSNVNSATSNATYKYIEFHNCEIDMDSLSSGYVDMKNNEGFSQEFTIDIFFDDCYENEYNQFIMREFGDFFLWDRWSKIGIGEDGASMGDIPEWDASDFDDQDAYDELDARLGGLEEKENNEINSYFQQLIGEGKEVINSSLNTLKQSAKNALTGGLGNIYGKGGGMKGIQDSIKQGISQQVQTLKNKALGNITGTLDKASKTAASTVTKPVLGTIQAGSNLVDNTADSVANITVKPVLGTLDATEKAVSKVSDLGTSYINEAGQYVENKTGELGNLAYDKQVVLANNVGKNRLNATKLGNIY